MIASFQSLSRSDPFVIIVLAVILFCLSIYLLPFWHALTGFVLGSAMLLIAYTDVRFFVIPDWLSLPAIPLGLLASGSLLMPHVTTLATLDNVAGALVGGIGLFVLRLVHMRLRRREGLGLGDVKLAMVAGAWTGVSGIGPVILLASGSAIFLILVKRVFKHDTDEKDLSQIYIPFGAFLAPSIWLVWMLQQLEIYMHV